jgi:RNA polymerase sigma-70 factor (ECF subfamily)
MEKNEKFMRQWIGAQPALAAYINSVVPDFHEAEDLLQNVAVVLLRKFEEFDESRPFLKWAMGVARYEILGKRRSYARSFLLFHSDLVEAVGAEIEEMSGELAEEAAALRHCLKKVEGRNAKVLSLRYEDGLKPRQIAEKIGMEPGAVRVMLSRVRATLHDCVRRRVSALRQS